MVSRASGANRRGGEGCAGADAARARVKIALVCSHGGHLAEMLELEEAFEGHDTFYFCYDADTTRRLPHAYLVPNMARNPVEFVKNLVRLARIFWRERPHLMVSTGAEIALPAALIAKLFRVPVLYIECGAQVAHPSFTGRIMYWLADHFFVQWPELLRAYGARAVFRGSLTDEDAPVPADRSAEKRLRVTLVQPAHTTAFSSDQPPMGLAYVASVLQQRGCIVRVIDANVEKLTPKQVLRLLVQQAPDVVCFTVTTPLLPSTLGMARSLRQWERPPVLVAGGPHPTVRPQDLLDDGPFDYVVRSEGEETIGELVDCLLAGEEPVSVAGLSWRREGSLISNPDRPLCQELERFAYPDWSLFLLKRYSSLVRRNDHSLPITTSRGCPFGCTFCYKGIYGRSLRMRSPQHVVDEWAFLVHHYGVREVAVLDDAFTFDVDRAIAICDLLVQRGLERIPWSTTNGIRVDNVTPELFRAMKRAGCYRVYFGAESGVQAVIDSLEKQITVGQVRRGVRLAKAAGLEVGAYFMLGNVGETVDNMQATIDFALGLDLDYAQFSIATPYPGTRMFSQVTEQGQLLINTWEDLASYGACVFSMGELTPDSVGVMFRKAIRRFYFRPGYMLRHFQEALTWTGIRHRVLATGVLVKLALFGGRKKARLLGTWRPREALRGYGRYDLRHGRDDVSGLPSTHQEDGPNRPRFRGEGGHPDRHGQDHSAAQ